MSIHAALYHKTEYRYARPASLSPQVIRLRPAPHARTPIVSYGLKVLPQPHFLNWLQDPHGNYLARVVFPEKITHFTVEVDVVADMVVFNPFDFFLEPTAEEAPFTYARELRRDLDPFLDPPAGAGVRFERLLAEVKQWPRQRTIDYIVDLNRAVQQRVDYIIRMEPGVQTPEESLAKGMGSCRDSAWLLVNLMRGLGLAARFASGYLIQLKPDVPALDGPSGTENDFTDLHAWAEVFLPGAGWVGLDPTSGLLAGEGHIPLACAPQPMSAAPISGSLEEVDTEFGFAMEVRRIYESPRVTKPYSDDAWQRILALGDQVDEEIHAQDLRLTMGGEPTFVSIDDMEGQEWTVGAVGPHKRRLSEKLMKRLWKQFAPGGFLHYGQGKWYPGESLPRWAFACYWRKDGEPVWKNPQLLADIEKDYGHGEAEAKLFARTLTSALDVTAGHVMPAYEDVWYYLWKERKLPSNVDPLDSKLENEEERARLAEIYERGLDNPRGFVLPLTRLWQARHRRWISGRWDLRQKHLYLIPGDSPVGLRLPLETLPWVDSANYPYVPVADPSAGVDPLPAWERLIKQYAERAREFIERHRRESRPGDYGQRPQQRPMGDERIAGDDEVLADPSAPIVRTALCVEPRGGKLHVFLPPLATLEDYLDLIAALEATAEHLELPIVIEGETPPHDPRIESFKITPDPGVIEVNIHPSASWRELVGRTERLYEEARLSRLGTEKVMLDGRHSGTGGGNHVVLGAATPLDSPFLRRPDLLRSMLAYWHQHPSLSYLFSSLFIGPTSQSPRVDEARDDALYELEIAFREVDRVNHWQPWLTDRIFRNLLTDLTGNTHRAEFCIDKLYSPDGSAGRLGLLELRSFEMPPHARMSLVQQLLVRALLVKFWKTPFTPRKLTRWGHALRDRFMLPYFIWQDFCDVIEDLRAVGLPFDPTWFGPHFEFRFPPMGLCHHRETTLELRVALDPWITLGEEAIAAGTARYVDSSVERLQVRLTHFDIGRYQLSCNALRVPLLSTGTAGEFVAGVRYRAWQPPSCLHPTIPVDTPLIFDLVDLFNERSVGGCTYYVGHPGGLNPTSFPVNAYEAESRRLGRFTPFGHTPGPLNELPRELPNPDFPSTLDMRLARA